MSMQLQLLRFNQILGGTYRVEDELSSGGYAVVYRAHRIQDGMPVVAKALRKKALHGDPQAVDRFLREATIAAQINHPNVVRTYDIGQTRDGVLYMVLERLYGQTLTDAMYQDPVHPAKVRDILCQILRGLAAAHARGIVHRDIKPSNVFLCKVREGQSTPQQVKVLDFGFVKIFDSTSDTLKNLPTQMVRDLGGRNDNFSRPLTMSGQRVGTPGYMAPELLTDAAEQPPPTPKMDLYAVGVLGYELLSGKPAFPGSGVMRALAQLGEPVKPPTHMRKSGLYLPILRLMARDPDMRPASAQDALRELAHLDLGDEQDGQRAADNRSWFRFWS